MATYEGFELFEVGDPVTAEDIRAMEAGIGKELPQDYKAFLKTINGGTLKADVVFPVDRGSGVELILISRLFTATAGGGDSILRHLDDYELTHRVPPLIIPIGLNSYEHRLCVSLRDKDYGSIYLWSPRDRWIDESEWEQTEAHLHFVAGSFHEFWKSLRIA